MRLGRRLLFLFYGVALSTIGTGVVAVYFLLMPAFFELEDDVVRADVDRVERVFMQMLTTLHARTIDWASGPAIEQALEQDSGYQALRVPDSSGGTLRLDQVVLFDSQGEARVLRHDMPHQDPDALEDLYQTFLDRACYTFWGIRQVDNLPVMFALEPVGDDCAAVLFGVSLDEGIARELSGISGLPVSFVGSDAGANGNQAVQVSRLSVGEVAGNFLIRDYLGEPVVRGQLIQPRSVHRRGLRMLFLIAGLLTVLALSAVTLVHFRIRRLVFARLANLQDTTRLLLEQPELDIRARVEGDDELAELAGDFNRLVDGLVDSQHQLAGARQVAEAANLAKSRFLANMSHEIRTPMTAILGYTELLRDGHLSARERAEYLDIIQHNSDALLVLINEVLDLSRIEAGQLVLEEREFSLPAVLDDVVQSHALRAREKGIELSLRYLTPVPERLLSDPFRIRQILVNLLGNAIKFTERGSVTLEVRWRPDTVAPLVVVVTDTGIGIPDKALEHVFEPFRQLDATDSREHGGSGLGLAIARQLSRSLGGDIAVESQPGLGSRFTVELVVQAVSGTLSTPLAGQPKGPELSLPTLNGTALLVEDNQVNRMFVRRVLERAGMTVVEATHGGEAVEFFRHGKVADLIVMDMQMPVMDGFEAVRQLRDSGCQVPILALTANVLSEERERCLAVGCDDFLGKPVRVHNLLSACHELLQQQTSLS